MSASAIADALVTMLSATSALGTGSVATNYSVLESSSGSCAVVGWTGFTSNPDTFGDPRERSCQWTMLIQGFVKDEGDPVATMNRVLATVDTIQAVINSDDTLQGTVEETLQLRGDRDPDTAVLTGGMTWLPLRVEVDCQEYQGG